jgi:FkbH-like protein
VAFVDDSPLELAEVQARFPEVRCLRFPKREPGALLDFFRTLREWFGRTAIRDEDRIRARSLQSPSAVDLAPADPAAGEAFLAGLQAHLSFRLSQDTSDERALELINKTNQFNLNGRRITESNWRETLGRPGMFLVTVAYTDRFGPLGKIAAVVGNQKGGCVTLSWWVMSCRAFSRRIEHATLRYLFERLGASRILLDFEPTERNGPLREFLTSLEIPVSAPEISRTEFLALCPHLAHSSEEPTHV